MNMRLATSLDPSIRQKLIRTAILVCLASMFGAASGFVAVSELVPDVELSGWWAVALMAGVIAAIPVGIWIVTNPGDGVLLLVAIVYANLSEVAVRNLSLPSLFQGIVGLLLVGVLLQGIRLGADYFRFDALLLLGGLFAALILLSSVYSIDPELTDERFVQALRGLTLAFLLVNLVRTPRQLDSVLWVVTGAAAFLAAITIFQVATGSYHLSFGGLARIKNAQIVEELFEPRVSGPLSDPNFYAQILLMAVPIALFRFWEASKLFSRVVAGTVLLLINIAIVFTYSRGAIAAAAVVYLIAALWIRVRPRHLVSFALVGVLVVLLIPDEATRRLDTLNQILPWEEPSEVKIDTSFQERTMLMKTAAEMFSDQPLLGVGAGNYTSNFDRYAPVVGSNISSYEGFDKRRFPHSLYLETAAELGIVGLFILVILISSAVVYAAVAARHFKSTGRPRASDSAAAIAIALIGYGTTSLFLHGAYMQYLWMLVGLAVAAKHIAIREGTVHNETTEITGGRAVL